MGIQLHLSFIVQNQIECRVAEQELNYRCTDEYSEELKALKSLARTIETTTSEQTYQRSAELIRDSYLAEYRKDLDETARANVKFSSVDFDGVTYWLRH